MIHPLLEKALLVVLVLNVLAWSGVILLSGIALSREMRRRSRR